MPDYQDGKIYVIRNSINTMVYVGSTTQTLTARMRGHRKCVHKKASKLYTAFAELGLDTFRIELIENFPCDSKEELTRREAHFIREYKSVENGYNFIIPCRSDAEYYIDNKQKMDNYAKEWRANNKEKMRGYYKKWAEANKEKVKEIDKEYREKNKEALDEKRKARQSQRVMCLHCNKEICRGALTRHIKAFH